MAPEQLEGLPPDGRSDQFAFGLTAYELLSGEYAGGPLVMEITPLDKIAGDVAPGLSKIVMRTLSFEKEQRFATMEEVANALRDVLPEVQVHAQSKTARMDETEKQHKAPVDPALMPTRQGDKQIGTVKLPATSVGPTTPMPARAAPRSVDPKNATMPFARPIPPNTPGPPFSQAPTPGTSFAPSNPRSSQNLDVRSSQNLVAPAFRPTPAANNTIWIVVAVGGALFALVAGGLLALFLR
jgi:hypothetical protein